MLETFDARIQAANQVQDETGQIACPCVIFPEVSGVKEIQEVIDAGIATLVEGMKEMGGDGAEWFTLIGGEAAVGHAMTVAAAAGYALALDSAPSGESFDPENVDWDSLPNIDDNNSEGE